MIRKFLIPKLYPKARLVLTTEMEPPDLIPSARNTEGRMVRLRRDPGDPVHV